MPILLSCMDPLDRRRTDHHFAAETAAARAFGADIGLIDHDLLVAGEAAWDTACYIPDLADTARLNQVVAAFVAEQGPYLAGGIVLRAFEAFTVDGSRATETRVWWLDGTPLLVGAHPDTPGRDSDPVLDGVVDRVKQLGARFVTTDLALRADGVWRVIEVGDGQVSDLPADIEPGLLVHALLGAPPSWASGPNR